MAKKDDTITSSVRLLTLMDANYGHIWLLPDEQSCLIYAMTEVVEAIEAQLRTKMRPNDSRNNAKEFDYEQELADTAMMLLRFIQARNPTETEKYISFERTGKHKRLHEYLDITEAFGIVTVISGMLNSYFYDENTNNYETTVFSYDEDNQIDDDQFDNGGYVWFEVFNSSANEEIALYVVDWIDKFIKKQKGVGVDNLISHKLNKIANRIDRKMENEQPEE